MGMASPLILIANPGSASRKYALFEGKHERADLYFEWEHDNVVCTLHRDGQHHVVHTELHDISEAAGHIVDILRDKGVLRADEQIKKIGLRVVAPSSYFLEDRLVDDEMVARLETIKPRAPIHVAATLAELTMLRSQFEGTPIVGVSDSAFHATKPDYAWNYGISLEDADRFEIKRFGYHGLSAAAVVRELEENGKLPPKLIVCHLGSGVSVTAIYDGKSIDTTMGYSPLEGVVMSTRSGSIDHTAVRALKDACRFDDDAAEDYLNNHSGLLGLGGSSDIRELLKREESGDNKARLALATYTYSVRKAFGQMAAALDGVDALVFTGTVGERSAPIRKRIIERLRHLDLILDDEANHDCQTPEKLTAISRLAHSKPVFVIPAYEAAEIARRCML